MFDNITPEGTWNLNPISMAFGDMRITSFTLVLTVEEPHALSDAGGAYTIGGVGPGPYEVRTGVPAGSRLSKPVGQPVTQVGSGQTISSVDFGFTQRALVSGRVFDDANGNGSSDAGEAGLAGVTLFMDQNDDHVPTTASVSPAAADTPKPLADNSTTTSTIQVAGAAGRLLDVNVRLNVSHPFDTDVDAFLISPSGTRVELFTDVGGDGDNFSGTVLDDQAATAIASAAAPFTGSFRPEGSLADFNGEDPNGAWALQLTDDSAGFSGNLLGWSLELRYGEPRAVTDAAGNYQFEPLPASRYILRQAVPAGMKQTTPASGFFDVTPLPAELLTGLSFANREAVPPQVLSAQFFFASKPHRLDVQFSENVSAGLAASALRLVNRTTGATVAASDLSFSYGSGNVASWTYLRGGFLPDGNYRATIPAAAAADVAGNTLVADFTFDFFVLAGDINRDRAVNGSDFAILAGNFGKSGMTYAQGDLNGDAAVNGSDFALLAGNFWRTVPAPAAALTAAKTSPETATLASPTPARRTEMKHTAAHRHRRLLASASTAKGRQQRKRKTS
jgi:subtilisin-like proprotein convertase family protein